MGGVIMKYSDNLGREKFATKLAILFFVLCSTHLFAEEGLSVKSNTYNAEEAYLLNENWSVGDFIMHTDAGLYSYFQLGEFLPQAIIARAGPVIDLKKSINPSLKDFTITIPKNNPLPLSQLLHDPSSPLHGLVIIHKGNLVLEEYVNMQRHDRHVWMSVAKPVVSLLIAKLEEQKRINVDSTMVTYMPELVGTAWANIKVIDLLNMQTGLDLEENAKNRADPNTQISKFFAAEVGLANSQGELLSHNKALYAIPKLSDPGKAFEYSSAITQMLGLLVEKITNKRLATLVSEQIWQGTGMDGDATLALSPQGNGIIHGLISSRLIDLAKFGMLYTPSSALLTTKKIVSENTLNNIYKRGNPHNYLKGTLGAKIVQWFGEHPQSNSYQWDAVFDDGDIYKGGMNGQGLYISPKKDIVIAWFSGDATEVRMERFARQFALSL